MSVQVPQGLRDHSGLQHALRLPRVASQRARTEATGDCAAGPL